METNSARSWTPGTTPPPGANASGGGLRLGSIARVLVAALLLAFVLGGETGRLLWRTLIATPWLPLCFTAQSLIGSVVEAERLRFVLARFGLAVARGRAVRVVLASAFLSACIPGGTGGDVMKFFYLDPDQVLARPRLAALVLFDRAIGLLSLLLAALLGAIGLLFVAEPSPAAIWLAGSAAGLLLAAVGGLWLLWSRLPILERVRGAVLARLPWGRVLRPFTETLVSLREWPGTVAAALLVSTVGQLVLGAAFVIAGRQVMPELSPLLTGSLALLGLVANVIPITPGGLGVGEVAFNALFRLAGAGGGARLVLLWRIGALPAIAAGGILYALGLIGGRAAARPIAPVPEAPR